MYVYIYQVLYMKIDFCFSITTLHPGNKLYTVCFYEYIHVNPIYVQYIHVYISYNNILTTTAVGKHIGEYYDGNQLVLIIYTMYIYIVVAKSVVGKMTLWSYRTLV